MTLISGLIFAFLLSVTQIAFAKKRRLDSVDCIASKQAYGSVLECGDDIFSVKQGSAVEKSLYQICREQFICKISFETNANDEVTKVLSAFSKGKKRPKTFPTSFDCKKAFDFPEEAICTNEELAKLDNQLGAEIKLSLDKSENTKKIRDNQKLWLQNKRDKCRDLNCLVLEYKSRLQDFRKEE